MESTRPHPAPSGSYHEVKAAVKEIIASIKMISEGPQAIPDDALLFSNGVDELSPLAMDSLDALDLALGLRERFDPQGNRFDAFMNGDVDLQALNTVNKITEYVLSLGAGDPSDQAAGRASPAGEQEPIGIL